MKNLEVLIVGGGIIGLCLARELRARGVHGVAIVDRSELGIEASWAAAGMLAPNIEAGTSDVFHRFCRESLELYPDLVARLLAETQIDIELDRSGTLCVAFDEGERWELGPHTVRDAELLSGAEIRNLEPRISNQVVAGVLFVNDWQVENRKLISAMRRSVELNNVRIIENCEVFDLLVHQGRVTGARTTIGDVHAETTVLATGAWTSLIKIGNVALPFSVKPVRGQMIGFETGHRRLRRVVYSKRGYVVPRSDGRVLVGATVEDVGFDKDNTGEGVTALRDAATEMVPGLSEFAITEQWAGLRPFAADGLPILGQVPGYDNAFVATAHYRNGILLAPRTAQIIVDRIIDGFESEFLNLFRPDRFGSSNAGAVAIS